MEDREEKWTMHGLSETDPKCVKSPEQLLELINRVGFLPLFRNEIHGFSVEETVSPLYWWTDDPGRDPWYWRILLSGSGEVAYGKFFDGKAGYVSKALFPVFACARREGYDFDSLRDEGRVNSRECKIMALFENGEELYSCDVKNRAGFGKGGEKNFEGTVTSLMDRCYLIDRDFRPRLNKQGQPYGWHIAVYSTPEHLWGEDYVRSAYGKEEECRSILLKNIASRFPDAPENAVRKLVIK